MLTRRKILNHCWYKCLGFGSARMWSFEVGRKWDIYHHHWNRALQKRHSVNGPTAGLAASLVARN